MRSTHTHTLTRARQVIAALCISISLSAGTFSADSVLLAAYHKEDMTVWKEYLDTAFLSTFTFQLSTLQYEYGYCGYIVAEAKKEGKEALLPEAKQYVQNFRSQISNLKSTLPVGYYEMYTSAVYVYELRLHESIHPLQAMRLAKKATELAPNDPLVLSYYGTCLYYAPKPFGDKTEALKWFTKAQKHFQDPKWKFCWVRDANEMYIRNINKK